MKEDPHAQLMLRFQGGDENAYRQLFDLYKTPLFNFIFRFCRDKRVAEELLQEVFLRVYKTVASYRPDAKFSTWIYRIATNICLNEVRSGRYRYEVDFAHWSGNRENYEFEAVDTETYKKTDDKIIEKERRNVVNAAIRQLPEKQRMALLCSEYDQLSYKEISERFGSSEGAIKSIIHRAKLALKDILKKEMDKIL